MSDARGALLERFQSRSRATGATVTRVPRAAATDAIAEACEPPVVAAPLPWTDLSLPDSANTSSTPADLEAATTGVTAAVGAVADYGTVLLRSTADGVEPVSVYPDRHVVVLEADAVLADVGTALATHGDAFREEDASIIFATGPSATADMGALVTGAHGPSEVEVIVLDETADDVDDADTDQPAARDGGVST